MAANRLADMTRDDLRVLIREVLQEVLWEMEQLRPDPDEGLSFKPEIAEQLRKATLEKKSGKSLDDFAAEMGIDE
ncbi:MAG: hypothetical protein OHK0046_08970 [Anaerolineae bacterium]